MQKQDGLAIGRAGFRVSDVQHAGIDLLQRAGTRYSFPGLIAVIGGGSAATDWPPQRSPELGGSDSGGGAAKEMAAMKGDFFRHAGRRAGAD